MELIFILSLILIFASSVQLFYYSFFYLRFFFISNKKKNNTRYHPVSVVICAKNEAEKLHHFLPQILNQTYPDYEVIVVNDGSTDKTQQILQSFADKYEHLKIVKTDNPDTKRTKKNAQTKGIEAAKNEWLLFTDADCTTQSNKWIETMASNFDDEAGVVLGYGGYLKKEGTVNKLIRYETIFIAMQYMTFAAAGIPYMGVGRNLAYRKSLFFSANGFSSHHALASGDDDLFVNQVANRRNVRIELLPESFTLSVPEANYKNWQRQKQRHVTTSHKYKLYEKILLSGELLSRILLYATFFALVFVFIIKMDFRIINLYCIIAFFLVIVRICLLQYILNRVVKHFKEDDLKKSIILYDIFIPFFYFRLSV